MVPEKVSKGYYRPPGRLSRCQVADRIREPPWLKYPRHFMRAVKLGILDLAPWQLLEGKWLRVRLDGFAKGDRAWLAHFLSSLGAPS